MVPQLARPLATTTTTSVPRQISHSLTEYLLLYWWIGNVFCRYYYGHVIAIDCSLVLDKFGAEWSKVWPIYQGNTLSWQVDKGRLVHFAPTSAHLSHTSWSGYSLHSTPLLITNIELRWRRKGWVIMEFKRLSSVKTGFSLGQFVVQIFYDYEMVWGCPKELFIEQRRVMDMSLGCKTFLCRNISVKERKI